jgi:hypothetical protein
MTSYQDHIMLAPEQHNCFKWIWKGLSRMPISYSVLKICRVGIEIKHQVVFSVKDLEIQENPEILTKFRTKWPKVCETKYNRYWERTK